MFTADRVLINGKIVIVDRNDSMVEAVAIQAGRFLALGATHEMMLWEAGIRRLSNSGTRGTLLGC